MYSWELYKKDTSLFLVLAFFSLCKLRCLLLPIYKIFLETCCDTFLAFLFHYINQDIYFYLCETFVLPWDLLWPWTEAGMALFALRVLPEDVISATPLALDSQHVFFSCLVARFQNQCLFYSYFCSFPMFTKGKKELLGLYMTQEFVVCEIHDVKIFSWLYMTSR